LLRQIQLIVFDLDYLLFDCSAVKSRALRQSLMAYADSIPQDIRLPDAVDIEEAFQEHGHRWIRFLDLGLGDELLAGLERGYPDEEQKLLSAGAGRIYAGLEDLLSALRSGGITTALGADATRDYLLAVSDRHDLDRHFDLALCTEEFGQGGSGEMLGDILNHVEVNPSEALVLGTRPSLFEVSHGLDLLTIGCGWGVQEPAVMEAADFQAPAVADLLAIIRRADSIAAQYAG
jgi:phosphoglycolate phosphatase-like HAD superfamily hydrolase